MIVQYTGGILLAAISMVVCQSVFAQTASCTRHIYNNSSVAWGVDFAYDKSIVRTSKKITLNGEERGSGESGCSEARLRNSVEGCLGGGKSYRRLEAGEVMKYTLTVATEHAGRLIAKLTLTTPDPGDNRYNQSFDMVRQSSGAWCPYVAHPNMSNTGRATLNEPANGDVIMRD